MLRMYSIPEKEPDEFFSESVKPELFSIVMLLYLDTSLKNDHLVSIQTVQHSTNDGSKTHLFKLSLLFFV